MGQFILVMALLLSIPAGAKNLACEDLLSVGRYRSLERASDIPADLKTRILAARQRVYNNLGWMPAVRRTDLEQWNALSDFRLFKPGDEKTKENAIGYSSYLIQGTELEMSWTEVQKKYRNNGLSELLLAEILAYHPEVTAIKVTDLTEKNRKLLIAARETMDSESAVKETYAYKRYAAFGFTEVSDIDFFEGKAIDFDENTKMILEYPHYRFTVKKSGLPLHP